ncbi:hypothetical protein B0H34DRAFT_269335 [Crassisporium funariophilum]|nr:hypothetical protein B0H34DRAFT_269335 [Crassisporium funariophilum]
MPKAQRHKPQIPENPRPATNHITPRSTAVVPPAVEFPEKRTSPSPAPLASTQPTFNPIHPVHFDELNRIWDADRRIPSAISRREWALPRNLNPVNVHSWWYRRRAVAKKLRIKIPGATYELAVGEPPIIVNEEEKEGEEAMLGNDDSDKEVDMDMDRSSEVTLVPGSEFDAPLIPHSEWLPQTPTKKRAYTHPSPTHNHNPSSLAGSLPPSSPPASPPLISWLVSPSLSADLSGSPAPSLEYTCSLSFGNPSKFSAVAFELLIETALSIYRVSSKRVLSGHRHRSH